MPRHEDARSAPTNRGALRLDQVGLAAIEARKADKLTTLLAEKTINNHLTVLRRLLSTAVEWRQLKLVPPIEAETCSAGSTPSRWPLALGRARVERFAPAPFVRRATGVAFKNPRW